MGGAVDDKALDLMEHRRMRLVGIAAVGAAWDDHPDRRLLRQHRAHLDRARMGAQNFAGPIRAGVEKEGVVHVARRMIRRKVQFRKIIIVALDIRPFGDGKAHVVENHRELIHHLAHRMDAPGLDPMRARRQGDIDGLRLEAGSKSRFLQHGTPCGESLRDCVLERVDRGASLLARFWRHCAKPRKQRRNGALLPECRNPHGFQARLRRAPSRFPREFALAEFGGPACLSGSRGGSPSFCHASVGDVEALTAIGGP